MNDGLFGAVAIGKCFRWVMMATLTAQIICLLSGTVLAETRWTPSLGLTVARDDNIQFDRSDALDDNVYLAQPQLKLEYEQELTRIDANGNVIVRRYQDHDEFNDEIYNFDFNADTSFSERFRLEGSYRFIKDTTLDSELKEVGRIFLREDRRSHYFGLAPSFNLTERLGIGLDGSYRDVAYDSDAFVDYTVWEINLPVNWRLVTQVDTIYFNPGYTNRDSDTTRSKTYNLRVGWIHKATERLSLDLSVGARLTELEEVETGRTDDNWNGVGNLKLRYNFRTGHVTIEFQRDLETTAIGEQADVTRVGANLQWYFSERFGIELSGTHYRTKTEGQDDNTTTEYMEAGSKLFYKITEIHDIFIAYEYSQEYEKDNSTDPRAERNMILAGVRLRFPL